MSARAIVYWLSTVLLVAGIGYGGYSDATHAAPMIAGMTKLGYPLYFVTLLGVWKILGALAILSPGLPRVKEWAYAGIFFDVTGAMASHVAIDDFGPYGFHIWACVVLLVLTATSWSLRPASRVVGSLAEQPF